MGGSADGVITAGEGRRFAVLAPGGQHSAAEKDPITPGLM